MTVPAIETVPLVTVQPCLPDRRYWELHRRSAAGVATEDEEAELDLLCAMKAEAND